MTQKNISHRRRTQSSTGELTMRCDDLATMRGLWHRLLRGAGAAALTAISAYTLHRAHRAVTSEGCS